jgi:drug/metabolite transporter (DMT)-like permease
VLGKLENIVTILVAMKIDGHLKGAVLTGTGILILSPDALLIRLIDADIWTILFWRGLLCGITMILIGLFIDRPKGIKQLFKIEWPELQVISVTACMHFLFVLAILNTAVANTLVIMSISPLLSALLSLLILHEQVARRTWFTTIAVFFGLAMIFSQSIGGGTLLGDASAFGVAVSLACNFVLLRRYRQVNMIPAVAWGMVLGALIAWPLATPMSLGNVDFLYMLLLGLVILPISTTLITLGPKYLPAPEVGLIMLLEAIFGPLWVWLVIHETPSLETLIGGAMILLTLSWISIVTIRDTRTEITISSK